MLAEVGIHNLALLLIPVLDKTISWIYLNAHSGINDITVGVLVKTLNTLKLIHSRYNLYCLTNCFASCKVISRAPSATARSGP